MVFPRTSVIIRHADKPAVIADPTRVMLYNKGQEYTREALSDRGDECEWFAVPPELIVRAASEEDPSALDRLDRPFLETHRSVDAETYLLQRRVTEHLTASPTPDLLFVEESIATLVGTCIAPPRASDDVRRRRTASEHRALAEACRELLSRHVGEGLTLFDVAARVGASAFHLARVFRREAKMTLHTYLHQLRARLALERVMAGDDLTSVALDLGYTSHSHFTATFRRVFGAAPSRLREPSTSLPRAPSPRASRRGDRARAT
jgi:AraC-like DNA-binding protein